MTKSFCYHNSTKDLAEDFENFFNKPHAVNYFDTWLTHTFEVIVHDGTIEKVECSLEEGMASFTTTFSDHVSYFAGKSPVKCADDLLNGFLNRISVDGLCIIPHKDHWSPKKKSLAVLMVDWASYLH